MKKLLLTSLAAAALSLASLSASAASADSTFNVAVSLTAVCVQTNASGQTLDFGTYTAFTTSAVTPASAIGVTFKCTRNTAPVSIALDGGTNYGVIAGLNYLLSTPAGVKTTTGSAATAVASGIGSADVFTYTINGSMPAGQAGDSSLASSATRTLTVTY